MTQPPASDRFTPTAMTATGELADDCCVDLERPERSEHDAGWVRAARQARTLSWFSLGWMTAEGALGLAAGVAANSIALVGWALGSVIEGLAAIIVIWRFTGARTLSEGAERRAQRAVGVSFFLLSPYLVVESVRDLWGAHEVATTVLGLVVTAGCASWLGSYRR